MNKKYTLLEYYVNQYKYPHEPNLKIDHLSYNEYRKFVQLIMKTENDEYFSLVCRWDFYERSKPYVYPFIPYKKEYDEQLEIGKDERQLSFYVVNLCDENTYKLFKTTKLYENSDNIVDCNKQEIELDIDLLNDCLITEDEISVGDDSINIDKFKHFIIEAPGLLIDTKDISLIVTKQ